MLYSIRPLLLNYYIFAMFYCRYQDQWAKMHEASEANAANAEVCTNELLRNATKI